MEKAIKKFLRGGAGVIKGAVGGGAGVVKDVAGKIANTKNIAKKIVKASGSKIDQTKSVAAKVLKKVVTKKDNINMIDTATVIYGGYQKPIKNKNYSTPTRKVIFGD